MKHEIDENITKYRKYDLQEIFAEGCIDFEDEDILKSNLEYDEMSISSMRDWVNEIYDTEEDEDVDGFEMTEEELVKCIEFSDYLLIKIQPLE